MIEIINKRKTEKATNKLKKLIFDGINNLKNLKERSLNDQKVKKVFEKYANELIEGLYSSVFGTILNSAKLSLEATFLKSNIEKKEFYEAKKLFESMPLEKITKLKEYHDFKKETKKLKDTKLSKIIHKLEELTEFNLLIKKIDNCVMVLEEKDIEEYMKKVEKIRRKRNIIEEAEKRLYGKIKKKRVVFTEEEKDMIFDKFDNHCAICGAEEGLHIHHKDGNPKNNKMSNLIVLCGVCHKKIHMKVR